MYSNFFTRYQHRRFVKKQGFLDTKNQERRGMMSFPDEWNTYVTLSDDHAQRVPRKIWMLWLQGENQAPPLIKASFRSWRLQNMNWDVIVLNEDTVLEYIDMPGFPIGVSPNHRANIIRLELLSRYGGVWADATSICLKPLDLWIDRVTPRGFFAFSKPQPLRPLANWFIASEQNSPAVNEWLKWSKIYILNGKKPDTYFWQHFTFKWLLQKDSRVKEIWDNTPHIIAKGPHILQRILDEDLNASTYPDSELMSLIPFVKLNWKKGYTLDGINNELEKRGISLSTLKEKKA